MTTRFVHAEHGQVGRAVRARVNVLTQTRSVLVVSARLAAPVLRRELEAEGVDLAHVFILDVTSHGIAPVSRDPEHEAYLPGPGMLELITKRANQIIRAKAERPVTVVVDDVATFARYNTPEALGEILQHADSSRDASTDVECVFSGEEPERVRRAAERRPEEHHDILASGELTRRRRPGGPGGMVGLRDAKPSARGPSHD